MKTKLTPLQEVGIWPRSQAARIAAERTPYALMRAKRVKTDRDIGRAAAHILRTSKSPNVDPDGVIEVVTGPRTVRELRRAIEDHVEALEPTSGGDPTRLIHFVCALPNRAWAEQAACERPEELAALKARMQSYVKRQFGPEQVMLLVWHYDEETPHLHALVMPLERRLETRGRKAADGSKAVQRERWFFNATAWFGTRAIAITEMSKRQDEYFEWVEGFGLVRGERGSKARHLGGTARIALVRAAAEQNEADAARNAADAAANRVERTRLDARARDLDAREAAWTRDSAVERQATIDAAQRKAEAIEQAAAADAAKKLAELEARIAEETGRRLNAEFDRLLALAEKARETTEAERAARDARVQAALAVAVVETERVVAAAMPEGHRYSAQAQAALAQLKAAAGIVAAPEPESYVDQLMRLRTEGRIPAFASAKLPIHEKSPHERYAELAKAAKRRQENEWTRVRSTGPESY